MIINESYIPPQVSVVLVRGCGRLCYTSERSMGTESITENDEILNSEGGFGWQNY